MWLFFNLVDVIVDIMSEYYTELKDNQIKIKKIIYEEELLFDKTIEKGILLFNNLIENTNNNVISGSKAFQLYNTNGFPLDLINVMANEKGYKIDMEEYNKEKAKFAEISKGKIKKNDLIIDNEKILILEKENIEKTDCEHIYKEEMLSVTIKKIITQNGTLGLCQNGTLGFAKMEHWDFAKMMMSCMV